MYPEWINVDGYKIEELTITMSFVAALIPSLFVLIIDYRIRIVREVERFK
jgi:hypothetical protein